jgi:phosphoglycolate phosphatase
MTVRAALFDFDFTLADPTVWLIPAWVAALEAIGEPRPSEAVLKTVVGKPLRAQYWSIVGEQPAGARFEQFERIYAGYRDTHAPAKTRLVPAAESTLAALSSAGILLGIVSTGAPERLNAILKRARLDSYFHTIKAACRDKAAGIGDAIGCLGVDGANTVYVGDHPDDCKAAGLARVRFYAVKTGVHGDGDFPRGTVLLTSVAELTAQLLAWD